MTYDRLFFRIKDMDGIDNHHFLGAVDDEVASFVDKHDDVLDAHFRITCAEVRPMMHY